LSNAGTGSTRESIGHHPLSGEATAEAIQNRQTFSPVLPLCAVERIDRRLQEYCLDRHSLRCYPFGH
jgi:hypothetical protein